jgi:hypothetical protein
LIPHLFLIKDLHSCNFLLHCQFYLIMWIIYSIHTHTHTHKFSWSHIFLYLYLSYEKTNTNTKPTYQNTPISAVSFYSPSILFSTTSKGLFLTSHWIFFAHWNKVKLFQLKVWMWWHKVLFLGFYIAY